MNLPKRFTIELTNRCNLNCPSCPRHQMTYPQGDITESLFKSVIDQLPSSTVIVPFFRGEATLHPQFCTLLNHLERFTTVQFATNGYLLTPAIKKAILDNITFLSLSLHDYWLPHQTGWTSFLYDCLGAGIETQVSILESQLPEKKRKTFQTEWSCHVDRIRIYEEHSKDGFGSLKKHNGVEPCAKPFEDMVCYWDGKVGLCNHDWNNSTELGDLNTQTVKEVWEGSKYELVRVLHQTRFRRQVESCKDCDFNDNKLHGELINAHN